MRQLSFKRHRFPADIIRHSVWLYARFTLSYRDVEEMLAERGLDISYETGRGRGQVTPLPPAQIPACAANAPGSCRRSDVIGHRGLGGPCSSDPWARSFGDMPIPALCPGHA